MQDGEYDASYLRDLADIVKNKTLFFVPFFGAFLAFLVGKTDYLKSAGVAVWVFSCLIFMASALYIYLVTQLLWTLENCRLVFTFRRIGALVVDDENSLKFYPTL